MGTHANEQWSKGLEECSNPEHEHNKQQQFSFESDKLLEARLEGYEDGIALMRKLAPWAERADRLGMWLEKMLYYAVGIYIGGVIASGKWIWW